MDLKDVLETWRTRLPNEWDDPVVWSDLLQWRNHIYSVVISAFEVGFCWPPALVLPCRVLTLLTTWYSRVGSAFEGSNSHKGH